MKHTLKNDENQSIENQKQKQTSCFIYKLYLKKDFSLYSLVG